MSGVVESGRTEGGLWLRFAATFANVDAAVEVLRGYLQEHKLDAVLFDVEMLAREALLNAVKHGCREQPGLFVRARLTTLAEELTLQVEDDGPGFAWQQALPAPEPAPESLSGRGLFILQSYADTLMFTPPGNSLTLTKRLPPKEQLMSQKTLPMASRISAQDAPQLREQLKGLINDGVRELTLDFGPVESIDSVGIGLLVATHNSLAKGAGRLTIVNASRNIYQLLTLMRLDKHFSIVQA